MARSTKQELDFMNVWDNRAITHMISQGHADKENGRLHCREDLARYNDIYDMLNEFHSSMIKWINEGKIKWKETIVDGLENAPNAFIGLFNGENFGKMLVKIGTEAAVAI
jgi:hypothetical protein